MRGSWKTHHKIIRFNISMNVSRIMHALNSEELYIFHQESILTIWSANLRTVPKEKREPLFLNSWDIDIPKSSMTRIF